MRATLGSIMKDHPLRTYRNSIGITQEQLADVLGVSFALVNHIENGRRRVTPENAIEWEKIIPLAKESLCPEIFVSDKKAA